MLAHVFLCTLAYDVEWHMRQAWTALMFADEDQAAKEARIRAKSLLNKRG